MSAPEPGHIQLWICAPDEGGTEGAEAQDALLSEEERRRAARFHFQEDRRAWSCAHALLRWSLSGVTGQPPHALSFEAGQRGKPRLRQPASAPAVHFSLSHTRTLVAVAVASDALGVDVERVDPARADADVAQRFFSSAEAAFTRSGDSRTFAERFFSIWTLKEAYLKARGLGLSVPLNAFSFQLDGGGTLALTLDDALGDRPEAWAVCLRRLEPDHHLALCARAGDDPLRLIAHRWTDPLGPPRPVDLPVLFETAGRWRGGTSAPPGG